MEGMGGIREIQGYEPGGSLLPGRNWQSDTYRFGAAGGQEMDDEIYGATSTSYTAEYWQYDTRIARRWNLDPVDKPWMSPYHAFSNKFITNIDPNGANDSPIYDSATGDLLGTDDQGLQGDAIVMDSKDFKQGMKHEDAQKLDKGWLNGFASAEARMSMVRTHTSLNSRPDYDGQLTLEEANEWFRTGNGQPLFVDAAQIDLSPVFSDELPLGQGVPVNFASLSNANLETGLVYGTILLTRTTATDVRIGSNNGLIDTYDFEQQPGRTGRNIATAIGGAVAGNGIGFQIRGYGTGRVRQRPPAPVHNPGLWGPKF